MSKLSESVDTKYRLCYFQDREEVCGILDQHLEKLFPDLDDESREVCVFGLKLMLFTAGDYVVLILAAGALGKILEGLLFLTVYSGIRSQAGGYHADSKLGCLGKFLIAFVICLCAAEHIPEILPGIYALICVILWISVAELAPVEAVGVPISFSKRKAMRKRALAIVSLSMLVSSVLYWCGNTYYKYILLAMGWNVIVLTAGKRKVRRYLNG